MTSVLIEQSPTKKTTTPEVEIIRTALNLYKLVSGKVMEGNVEYARLMAQAMTWSE